MRRRGWAKIALLTASYLALATTAHAETRVTFSSGVEYSSGDYGDIVDTEVVSVPMSARVNVGDWAVRISAPYLSITGPADVADTTDTGGDGGDGSGAEGTIMRTGTERGLGDTSLSVSRAFRNLGRSNGYLELMGRVKLPTGDEDKGLGVGTVDYLLNGEFGTSEYAGGVSVSAGYRFLGDRGDLNRQNGWQASVGGWLRAGQHARVGVHYSWREASTDSQEDPAEIGGYLSFRLSESLRVSLNASGGLSDSSPDYSTGLRFTWRSEPLGGR
jgi:hypothetical protein